MAEIDVTRDEIAFRNHNVLKNSVGCAPPDFLKTEDWSVIEQLTLVHVLDKVLLIHGWCITTVSKVLIALEVLVVAVVSPPKGLVFTLFCGSIRECHSVSEKHSILRCLFSIILRFLSSIAFVIHFVDYKDFLNLFNSRLLLFHSHVFHYFCDYYLCSLARSLRSVLGSAADSHLLK